ncbi:hypothetical protein Btru_026997 [Bulinus truncatus]|nr:hypothetical protein Btru_026997 [Bulinus truncatus]
MEGILNSKDIDSSYSDRADFYAQLYDDAWRSEDSDGTTLSEVPVDYFDNKDQDLTAEPNNDLLSYAITEVSLDFLSGSRTAVTLQRALDSDDSQTSSDYGIKTAPISKGSYAKYPETTAGLSDNDWNPYGTESDSNTTPRLTTSVGAIKQTSLGGCSHLSFNPPLSSTKYNNPHPGPAWDMSDISEGAETNTQYTLKPCLSLDSSLASDVNEPLILKRNHLATRAPEELNKTFRNNELENKMRSNITSSRHCKDFQPTVDFTVTDTSQANQNKLRMKDPRNQASAAIDYDLLQRDLQEIQDSLQRTLGPEKELAINRPQSTSTNKDSPRSLESDIIPSTTTTPEKVKSNTFWGITPRILLDNKGSSAPNEVALRKPTHGYSSDGDEAHTSGSSDDRIEDHALSNVTDFLQHQHDGLKIKNAKFLLTDSSNRKSLVQSNHRQLNSQGLVEKVLRILASEDPDHQVTGILSEISLSERKSYTRYAPNLQNISSFSHDIDNGGLFEMANIRKKLELSGLSSSKVSFSEPSCKDLGAVEAQTLPDQMFTQMRNIRIPRQVIECYPVLGDGHPKRSDESNETKSQAIGALQTDGVNESQELSTCARPQDDTELLHCEDKADDNGPGTQQVSSDEQSSSNKPQENSPASSDSDASFSRRKDKYRPYKPPGSNQVYYTESDAVSIADSVTTVESSHLGSDDARGPFLPVSVFGSRADPPDSIGIYGTRKSNENRESSQALASIPEKPSTDEQESEASRGPTLETNTSHTDVISFKTSSSGHNDPQNPSESAFNAKVSEGCSSEKHAGDSAYIQSQENFTDSQHFPQETRSNENGEFTENQNLNPKRGYTSNKRCDTSDRQKENNNSNWRGMNNRNLDYIQSSGKHEDELDSQERNRIKCGEKEQRAASSSRAYSPDSSTRNVYISQAFHRALSPDILESIGHRSPLLGRTIEQSLAQPPAPNRCNQRHLSPGNTKRSGNMSVPPTFLARDRGFYQKSGRDEGNRDKRRISNSEAKGKPVTLREYDSRGKSWDGSSRDSAEEALRGNRHVISRPVISESCTESARPILSLINTKESVEMQRTCLERADEHDARLRETRRPFAGRNVEITLEDMSTDSQETELDHEPVSQRAKLLTNALTREADPGIPQDIHRLWEQFQAANQSVDSSLSSVRVEGVADLLRNPAQHLIAQYMREREKYRIQRLERSELEMEKKRAELEKLRHKYLKTCSENVSSENEKEVSLSTHRAQMRNKDKTAISLFSIMEDASFEKSPGKSASPSKLKIPRQQHLIDPQMKKLRERITNQRKKAEKQAVKEQYRMDKLKKLEHLLMAKKQGKISDKTFERHLDDISLTASSADKSSDLCLSSASDYSQDSRKLTDSQDTTPLSNESTTAKDSSTDMLTWKAEKLQRLRLDKSKKSKNKHRPEEKGKSFSRCHHDPLKLFQLVRDGYLTPSEAYKLSLQKDPSSEQDVSTDSHCSDRSSSDRSFTRPHKLYSPYSRNRDEMYPKHPVPKLKLSIGLEDHGQQNKAKLRALRHSEKVKNPTLYPRNHVASKARKTFDEPADDESSRSVLSDDVSSFHNNEQFQDGSHHLLSLLRKSSNMPQAGKQPREQDLPIVYKENQNQLYRKKKGLSEKHKLRNKNMSENAPSMTSPRKGIAWDIPLTNAPPSKPRPITQPLKERSFVNNTNHMDSRKADLAQNRKPQADLNIWNTNYHPEGIPRKLWEKVLQRDPLASKINHWDVDPLIDRVQYILDRQIGEDGLEDKQLGKIGQEFSLQESFLARKQDFISKCRERQKRIALARKNRHLQECLRLEREALFGEQDRVAPSNLFAHPYSDNLFQPKRRALTKQEMKDLTSKRYKKLPEVLQKQAKTKRSEEIKMNRLRLKIFSRKVQSDAKRKFSKRSHS